MLMTQRLQLPSASDEELSQFTESDGGSVAGIEGIQPIEDTPSQVSEASDDDGDLKSDAPDLDHDDGNNDTLVHGEDDDVDSVEGYIDGNIRNSDVIADDIDCNIDDDCDDHDNDHGIDDNGDDHGIIDNHDDNHNDAKENVGLGGHSKPSFDDVPIKPGLGGQTRTFEELLNQQLQTEQRSPNENEPAQPTRTNAAAKKTFLRKGEGIARFGMKPKIVTKQGQATMKDKNLQNRVSEERVPVTRKTATVKDYATVNQSRTPAVGAQAIKPINVQKPEGPVTRRSLRHESDQEKQPFSPKKVHFTTRPSQGPGVYIDDDSEEHSESSSEDEELDEDSVIAREGEEVIQDSFQEQMKKLDELEVVEKQELNEFELLEEAAAANCSLSSNSSTVLRILGTKQKQWQADVNNNMLTARQMWTVKRTGGQLVEANTDPNRTLTEEKSDDSGDDTLKDPEVVSVRSSLALSDGFDDTKTWEEHDILDVSDVTNDVMHVLNTSTPDEKRRSAQAHNKVSENTSSTPPTSALVTKLFPQLKNQNKVEVISRHPQAQQLKPAPPATEQVVGLDGIGSGEAGGPLNPGSSSGMSVAVRDKLQELEKEIEKFREENIGLHRLREERERDLQELQKERALFESHKREELDRLEKFKTEEEKRLRRDKKVFEQYQKASRALPDKKEREEITALKEKVNELQEDLKLRESRWSAAATRYKDRIGNLERENREMREEVKLLEKQNLDFQRKEQQKSRELHEHKAFEKKKLKMVEEMPTKRGPLSNNPPVIQQERDHIPEETGKSNALDKQKQKLFDNSQFATKDISPSEAKTTVEQVDIKSRKVQQIDENEKESISSTCEPSKEHSPPTKQVSSAKCVRFQDDALDEKGAEISSKQLSHSDGKRETINPDGSRVVTFTNGTRKQISADGLSVVVTFFNGDIKQIFPDERVEYYYAEVQTTHTTYPDGLEVLRFPSNQIEKHYPDGTKEIIFPDQTVKYLYTSGAEECVFTDGTVERISVDGERIVEFPNGQRETYTKLYKKREYPDGTVKTVYTDGRQETRYASGRLRVKDGEGRLLIDTAEQNAQAQQSMTSGSLKN
ncbi:centromere protein J-like [Dendronephthya gigantea]|uniref:centromere protein J-like n=1 Tax=Dendronephthya gigantea TaxID=151771 RepID=UPI00106A1285|nr:centromere protein J-like [Dendronephthya gigantea]